MKKLLSVLGIMTIVGTATPTIITNPVITTKLDGNNINSPTKNLTLKSKWNTNVNLLVNEYCFLCHNSLVSYISHNTWQSIAFNHDTSISSEFKNNLFGILNTFEEENESHDSQNSDYISSDDIDILVDVIIKHYNDINKVFLNKTSTSVGLKIRTNRVSYWEGNSKFWGVNVNNGK